MARILAAFLIGLLGIVCPAIAQPFAQTGTRLSVAIPRVAAAPRIEDFLTTQSTTTTSTNGGPSEQQPQAIERGLRVDSFLQREPGDLVPATERTEAYLSYDATNVYAVFVCHVRDVSTIRARMAKRESIFSDDVVGLMLDTFNDHQRAYMFFATPLGIQGDGIVTEGQNDDFSFDTVWHSTGRLTDFGYVVSMAIPFKSLRFKPGAGDRTWGVALYRSIPFNNENDFWPGITRKLNAFTGQFADASGFAGVSPGRNLQFIPYGTFTGARFLDDGAIDTDADGRVGIDSKVVIRDALTVDMTVNPDFSQVESDEPQVTVNQRFEVFFPEKRPFFLENSGYFQTPLNLFFSRRIRDPQFGGRATGKVKGWAVGALAIDDRAPGQVVEPNDPLFGDRAFNAVARARREVGNSAFGALVTSRSFGPDDNQVASVDTRLALSSRWVFDGQAVVSDTHTEGQPTLTDTAYSAGVSRSGRMFSYNAQYQDIGRDFRVPLGFVPRTDIRQAWQFMNVRWWPKKGPVESFGPNSYVEVNWDQSGNLTDWQVRYPFQINFRHQTGLFVRRTQSMERFEGIQFDEHESLFQFYTSYFKWLDFSVNYAFGARPNFFPAEGIDPFLADFRDVFVSATFRPASRLLLDETYIYSHLATRPDTPYTGNIFDNHIARSRMNYQFNRELSLRGIVDYNAVLSNPSLVDLDRTKHLTFDVLLTYLLNPGTALYVGYTDGYDNIALDGNGGTHPISNPTTPTGRQFFVKTSYLFRF